MRARIAQGTMDTPQKVTRFQWCVKCGRDKDKCSCAEDLAAHRAKLEARQKKEALQNATTLTKILNPGTSVEVQAQASNTEMV